MKNALLITLALGTLGFMSFAGAAPPDRGDDDQRKRRGPPKEAIAACADLELDDACRVVLRGEEKVGQCFAGPDNRGPMACRPDDMPDRDMPDRDGSDRNGPPPERE